MEASSGAGPGLSNTNTPSISQVDNEEPYLINLQGSESSRLVDFLDEVRALPLVSFHTYRADSAGPRCSHSCRRYLPTMSAQITSHLHTPLDLAVIAYPSW